MILTIICSDQIPSLQLMPKRLRRFFASSISFVWHNLEDNIQLQAMFRVSSSVSATINLLALLPLEGCSRGLMLVVGVKADMVRATPLDSPVAEHLRDEGRRNSPKGSLHGIGIVYVLQRNAVLAANVTTVLMD